MHILWTRQFFLLGQKVGCTDVKYRFRIGLDLHTSIALEVKGHMGQNP